LLLSFFRQSFDAELLCGGYIIPKLCSFSFLVYEGGRVDFASSLACLSLLQCL